MQGVVYETSCQACCDEEGKSVAKYVGESARSVKERYGENIEDAEKDRKDSHMGKHWAVQHQGKRTDFKVEVVGYFSSALERQVAEGVRISKTGAQ